MADDTFDVIVRKLQSELEDIISNRKEVNEYELIVYKYIFISELGIPLQEDLGVRISEDSFILFVIPDNLNFSVLRKLDDAFDKFDLRFLANQYNLIKLEFVLR